MAMVYVETPEDSLRFALQALAGRSMFGPVPNILSVLVRSEGKPRQEPTRGRRPSQSPQRTAA